MTLRGGEYNILSYINSSDLKQFQIIIIEFHHLSSLLTPLCFKMANELFSKILENHYVVSNVPNRYFPYFRFKDLKIYDMIEVTFLKKNYRF